MKGREYLLAFLLSLGLVAMLMGGCVSSDERSKSAGPSTLIGKPPSPRRNRSSRRLSGT